MTAASPLAFGQHLPDEPVEIGTRPQLFVDDYIVDNRWAFRTAAHHDQALVRRSHQPRRHPDNPLIAGQGGYVTVVHDEEVGLYRMWWQAAEIIQTEPSLKVTYAIKYAQSEDGLNWALPNLGLYEWKGETENNVIWRGLSGTERVQGGYVLDLPPEHRRGYKYVMLYKEFDGLHLIASNDGIHWDKSSDMQIAEDVRPDTNNCIVYDPAREKFVLFTRSLALYTGKPFTRGGASRRIARFEHDKLWDRWPILPNREKEERTAPPDADRTAMSRQAPQMILIPDATDAERRFNFYYGMPTRYYAGIYWGFFWPFKHNTDIYTELVVSRDGERFDRFVGAPPLMDLGEQGAWDDGMVFASPKWVEHGDEWWIYYAGHDGPHESKQRTPGIGLATIRKEGFISLRGPEDGGMIVTRAVRWPGGDLQINADAADGKVQARISDHRRRVIPGFDFEDCETFTGDDVRHTMQFEDRSMDELESQIIRIEFMVERADIYSFLATGSSAP